jgi:hypothetical protein
MNEQEIDNFIRVRNYSIETILYTWINSKEKIISLIKKISPSDQEKINNLLTTVDTFEEIIHDMSIQREFGVNSTLNEKMLKTHEKSLFKNKLNELKEWYVDFLALLISDDSDYNKAEAPSKLWKEYEKKIYEFRYLRNSNYKYAKQNDKLHEWKTVNNFPANFSYTNIFSQINFMRNNVTHNIGARANRSGIPIKKDHILDHDMPGNSITLSNTITLCIYGYLELLEKLDESMDINKKKITLISKSCTEFRNR